MTSPLILVHHCCDRVFSFDIYTRCELKIINTPLCIVNNIDFSQITYARRRIIRFVQDALNNWKLDKLQLFSTEKKKWFLLVQVSSVVNKFTNNLEIYFKMITGLLK